jgi:dipeptidyl aminopeptidase/acylaminoacyl peptidase
MERRIPWRDLGRPPAPGLISAVALSPDGMLVVAVITCPDLETDVDRLSLWISPRDRAKWERLWPEEALSKPQFSPDGAELAGFATKGDGSGQILLVGSKGGPACRQISPPCLTDGKVVWHPSERRVAYSCAPVVQAAQARPHVATSMSYDLDGRGWLGESVRQIHVAEADGGQASPAVTCVTNSPTDCADVSWSPDGSFLVYVSARHDGQTRDFAAQVMRLDLAGSERILTPADMVPCSPTFAPDGTALVVAALTGADGAGRSGALFVIDPRDGDRFQLTDPAVCDVAHPLTGPSFALSVLAQTAFTLRLNDGAVHLIAADIEHPGTWSTVLGGAVQVAAMAAAAHVLAAAVYSTDGQGQVLVLEDAVSLQGWSQRHAKPAVTPAEPAATTAGSRTAPKAARGLEAAGSGPEPAALRPRKVTARASDGETISAWLLMPAADEPLPLVAWLHGGPMAQAGWVPPPDAVALARQGIACVYPNPRGSAGRGEGFARAVVGKLGDMDRDDVSAVVDMVAGLDEIDESRIGVHGVSYGGYLAAMTWSSSAVYRAAIVERGITSWDVHRAISDLGVAFTDAYWHGGPPAGERPDPVNVRLCNRSPVLIVVGEKDRRCPLAESQLLFARLLESGVKAELAVLPDVGHGLATARPSSRRDRAALIAGWWSRHLVPGLPG